MPKTAINYSKSCIYKIVCNDINITECYVGSTTKFSTRKNQHKTNCNNENGTKYNVYVYQFIRDHGGWDNWDMLEIEKYECNDNNELKARERYWIEELKAVLNQRIPTRTKDEYYNDNKEQIDNYKKQWVDENKDRLKEYRKQRRINNKEKDNENNRQRYLLNKDIILQRNCQRYQDKKEEILQKQKEKIECECGSVVRKADICKHNKTKLHQAFIQTI